MRSCEWAVMILVDGFDDKPHATKLVDVVAPARAGVVNRGAPPLAPDLERPAGIGIFQRRLGRLVGPYLISRFARFDGIPLAVRIALLGAGTREASTIWPDMGM